MEALTRFSEWTENFRYIPQESPMAYWPIPLATSFIYLGVIFVLRKFVMKNRAGYKLFEVQVVHNFIMTVISALVFVAMSYNLLHILWRHNFDHNILFCDTRKEEVNQGSLYFWIYVFYLSKYYELLDTLLIVLRKRELKFLHAYHHWATLILIYVCLEVQMPVQWIAEWLNSLVHIPMYYYYLISVLGVKDVWWKKYLTMLQIVQFVVVDLCHLASFYHHYVLGGQCSSFDTWGNQFGFAIINSYLVLFVVFFFQTYKHKSK